MRIVVAGHDHIGYHVAERLYAAFLAARDRVNVDVDPVDDPDFIRYYELRDQITACKPFVIDVILTGDE